MVTKEALLNRSCLKTADVEIVGVGTVRVRELTAGEGKALAGIERTGKPEHVATAAVLKATLDQDGNRMFADADAGKLEESLGLSVLTKLAEAIFELSGQKKKPADAAA